MTLTCTACGSAHSPHQLQTVCRQCGHPLRADYFFSPQQFLPEDLGILPSLWRFMPFLPSIAKTHHISLGESNTPLLEYEYQGRRVYLKDESANPTASLKDRGVCLALSMALALGVKQVALSSTGNAAISTATYALAAGLPCRAYLPETAPAAFIQELRDSGAEIILTGGDIANTGIALTKELKGEWFDISSFKEPYRVEGIKTLGLEITEQLDWDFPEVVVYPSGSGAGLIGILKAFRELHSLDWVRKPLPRMVAVQSEECAPIVKAFLEGAAKTGLRPDNLGRARELNVPSSLGEDWTLSSLSASSGTAIAIPEVDIGAAQQRLVALTSIPAGPEAAVAWRGMELLIEHGWIKENERVVVVITGDDRRYR